MTKTLGSAVLTRSTSRRVSPSIRSGRDAQPFTMDQELSPFGNWVGTPIWVPPKDSSRDMAKSMLNQSGLFTSKQACWSALIEKHRSQFTQVREIELSKASIRLPMGKLLVSVTEQDQFDQITDTVPNCVRTRLGEFLAGPGKRPGVKVYFLKPLCVEVGDELVFTTQDELNEIIANIQREVFGLYRRDYLMHRPVRAVIDAMDDILRLPRKALSHFAERRKREIKAYHAKLEFNRRKATWRAAKCRRKFRSDECTFEDILLTTKTPDRVDVIKQYAVRHQLSQPERKRMLLAANATLPWFVSLSLGAYFVSNVMLSIATPVLVCDPAFVAEMPGSNGVLLKIGHFDEVRGVTHVEI